MRACPLGSGALAGTPFNIDRVKVASSLGFEEPSENSMHAVADRDFVGQYFYFIEWLKKQLKIIVNGNKQAAPSLIY